MTKRQFTKRFVAQILRKASNWSDKDSLRAMATLQAVYAYDNPLFDDDRDHPEACADEDMRYWSES